MTSNVGMRPDRFLGARDRPVPVPLIDGIVWWEGTPLASGTAPPQEKGEHPPEADAASAPQQPEAVGPADSW